MSADTPEDASHILRTVPAVTETIFVSDVVFAVAETSEIELTRSGLAVLFLVSAALTMPEAFPE